MDTTETYIKMCDCKEVQDKAPCSRQFPRLCEEHNFIVDTEGMLLSEDGGYYYGTMGEPPFVWLPRQDQIQEWLIGVKPFYTSWITLIKRVYDFAFTREPAQIHSMEQLWLAFYMQKAHGLIWDGNEWVDQSIN
jgi:hypothetical protein